MLPAAALATPWTAARFGPPGVLVLWSCAILAGGAGELGGFLRRRRRAGSPLAGRVFRIQGNLSLVAVALSLLLLWLDRPELVPGLWLLLVGHSLYALGGLAFPPLRRCGLAYEAGGAVALWPGADPLVAVAVTTGLANLGMAWAVWRAARDAPAP